MAQFKLHYVEDVVLISLDHVPNDPKILAMIFTKIADAKINIDMISQTTPYRELLSVSFTINASDLSSIILVVGDLKQMIPELSTSVMPGNCKIVLIGELLKTESGIAAKLFCLIAENDLHVALITTSEVEISALFEISELDKAKKILREAFID